MLDTTTFLTVVIAVIIGVFVAILIYLQQKIGVATKAVDKDTKILKLQAYERLILLANRIAIPSLITRLQNDGKSNSTLSATDQQLYLYQPSKKSLSTTLPNNSMYLKRLGIRLPILKKKIYSSFIKRLQHYQLDQTLDNSINYSSVF
jgi:hypothetical protein